MRNCASGLVVGDFTESLHVRGLGFCEIWSAMEQLKRRERNGSVDFLGVAGDDLEIESEMEVHAVTVENPINQIPKSIRANGVFGKVAENLHEREHEVRVSFSGQTSRIEPLHR